MLEQKTLRNLNDYFLEKGKRREPGIYFYRINGYNEAIGEFLLKYYEEARRQGVVIEGKIPNPDEKNLAYYNEIMGMDFRMDPRFFDASMQKWLPRMNGFQRESVVQSLYDTLHAMKMEGKNDNMLKNAYIKFMCWLYYKFERIVNQLGAEKLPKILYEGEISNYELKLITILAKAGCDVVLLQYQGDAAYRKLDAASKISFALEQPGLGAFPEGFCLKYLREKAQKRMQTERLYGVRPQMKSCTNAWMSGDGFADIKKAAGARGTEPNLFYNAFCRMTGVEDKLTYLNELYQFQMELKHGGRTPVIMEGEIPAPSMDEIASIQRKSYQNIEQMLFDLAGNIKYTANIELQRLMNQAFIDIITKEAEKAEMNLNRTTNRAVYLLCWLKRYQAQLFPNWNPPNVGVFIYLGGCRNENETLFLRFLARLPVDVLILAPDLNRQCRLEDPLLYETHYTESLHVERYPRENADIRMGTAAYHAERELDTIMYQDSGMYRNHQYQKAVSVNLQTMYEEIALLWNQELKYRPNFSVVDAVVNMPVIFAKVSGVKEGDARAYWSGIKALLSYDVFLIGKTPYDELQESNPVKAHATAFFKNGRVQKTKIREHACYQYRFLREEMQEYILDKIQLLIDQRTIRGTFENGTEYTIVATALNLPKEILRLIQKFDFTKKNPKLIWILTDEKMLSLEETILAAFLNLIGFDIIFFVPTGYQSVEQHLNRRIMEEHQIGEYLYDLRTPDFGAVPSNTRHSWRDKIFKRGN